MKTTLIALIVAAGLASVSGQGTVNFANTPFGDGIDRSVEWCNGANLEKLTGTNYVAALYFGVSPASLNSFAVRSLGDQSLASAVGHFRDVDQTSFLAGIWVGGLRYFPGIDVGQTVQLQVRIWDFNRFATFDEARAARDFLQSDVFSYLVPEPADTAGLRMKNLRAFTPLYTCVPEPSIPVIAGVGLAGICLVHSLRKQS